MLSNLRAMAVFACVAEQGSFCGAADVLGISTSAVSQQVRLLEQDLKVVLLHRSTRKISLTEAGEIFFRSCQEMVAAVERGKTRINELQEALTGELKIATTPELGAMHIVPALSKWLMTQNGLHLSIQAAHQYIDLRQANIDIAIRMGPCIESNHDYEFFPLARVEQLLLAAPAYLNQHAPIESPRDLKQHDLLPVVLMTDYTHLLFHHVNTEDTYQLKMHTRMRTDNVMLVKSLCLQGHGIARILALDAEQELKTGELMTVLPQWKLPEYILYAVVLKRTEQPSKIIRCLEILKTFFLQKKSS